MRSPQNSVQFLIETAYFLQACSKLFHFWGVRPLCPTPLAVVKAVGQLPEGVRKLQHPLYNFQFYFFNLPDKGILVYKKCCVVCGPSALFQPLPHKINNVRDPDIIPAILKSFHVYTFFSKDYIPVRQVSVAKHSFAKSLLYNLVVRNTAQPLKRRISLGTKIIRNSRIYPVKCCFSS